MNSEIAYVVDDDPAVLVSIAAILNLNGFATRCFSSAEEFLAQHDRDGIGCLITDLNMPGLSGVQLLQRLVQMEGNLAVVVVTGVADVPTAVHIMEQGAITLLEKPFRDTELITAVRRAIEKSRELTLRHARSQCIEDLLSRLTSAERDVLNCLLGGMTNKSISLHLGISPRTVDRRRQAIFVKFGVQTMVELASRLVDPAVAAQTASDHHQ